jgi:D-tyrosyl-tRNA(Tyr) deacylase
MRAVVQLVSQASVTVDQETTGAINDGLVVFLGIGKDDTEKDARYLVEKIAHLRIFPDGDTLMNRSILDIQGEMLIISQFTLYGDCRKGRRPSYSRAARPEQAAILYHYFIQETTHLGIRTATGRFQAMMKVSLVNDGPVTIMLDSKKPF